jgi:aspartyl-tRNA synthetase
MSNWKRTHSCGSLGASDAGEAVILMGWVKGVRDLGGITFIDLRDRRGLTQIVVAPDARQEVSGAAKEVGSEWVIAVRGRVARRDKATINPNLPTGEIEVVAEDLRVLSESKTPPFLPDDDLNVGEELRLRHRYLDLRRPLLLRNLATRSRLALSARSYLDQQDFYEIETPYLTKSTPEGARDYLVPSRTQKGSFYALPQSPQLFKQILMVAGFDRYFQIARCFRDEDLRADRQPEFTQIDIEMSFVEQDDVFEVVEGLFVHMLGAVGIAVSAPFPRLTWAEAMDRYGSDKPDLRYGLEITDVSKVFSGSGYGVFEKAIEQGGAVRAMVAPSCAGYSRKDIDGLEKLAKSQGAAGLGWARWADSELSSPMSKHVGEARLKEAFQQAKGGPGDLLLLVAGEPRQASGVLGALRVEVARREQLAKPGTWQLAWITEFPLFERDESSKQWTSSHHPFTSPHPDDMDRLESDPGSVRSLAYDVVACGYELASGSIRIHRADVQSRIFRALKIGDEEAQAKFGFFLEALQYGAPPHGGIALGFDRIAMVAAGGSSLRDVIAFPKTTSALDLMAGSPSPVTDEQLRELGLARVEADRGKKE